MGLDLGILKPDRPAEKKEEGGDSALVGAGCPGKPGLEAAVRVLALRQILVASPFC